MQELRSASGRGLLTLLVFAIAPACGPARAAPAGVPELVVVEPGAVASPPNASSRSLGTRSIPAGAGHPGTARVALAGRDNSPGAQVSLLSLDEARESMLALINRDRASAGLPPVELDHGPAERAAQRHAEDMAKLGYLGHWGSDGSVPEQRSTEAGGGHLVLENALCFMDQKKRTLDSNPRLDVRQIERAESMFFDEVPPNDGHRKNILKSEHTHVAIGIALPRETESELPVPCFCQEFVDAYGTYEPLVASARPRSTLHVAGRLNAPATPIGVGLAKVVLPQSLDVAELNRRRSYAIPKPYVMYWTPEFKTSIPLHVADRRFSIDVPLPNERALVEVSIWAKLPGRTDPVMVGLRTLRVE